MNENKGLTLVEIIIAVAVIGILATLAGLAVNNSQKKVRDNRRIEDMVMIRSAMQLIFNESGSFNKNTCAEGMKVADCEGEEFRKYINNVPALRDPDSKGFSCVQDFSKGCDYAFQTLSSESYSVFFFLEKGTQGYAEGQHVLTERGIQ